MRPFEREEHLSVEVYWDKAKMISVKSNNLWENFRQSFDSSISFNTCAITLEKAIFIQTYKH